MQLGREVINSKEVPAYVLPKMKSFLESNGPWQQLVSLKNIVLHSMEENISVNFDNIAITAFKPTMKKQI
jgi:pyrroloquinoline quinone biosynthesis protein B